LKKAEGRGQEGVDNSLSEITSNQLTEQSVARSASALASASASNLVNNAINAAIKAEGSVQINGNSDFDGQPLNLNDDAFIYAGKGFSINGKTVLPVQRNAAGEPLTDANNRQILVEGAVTVATGYLYSNVSANNRYSGLVPSQIVDKQTIDIPAYSLLQIQELNSRIPAGTPTVTFNVAQNSLSNASDWTKKFPAPGTTTSPTVVKVIGGGLNIPSNVTLNNYVITVESGDLNFNGSGHNLNKSILVTKSGNINFANAQAKDVKAFASGSINMNGGATFAGDSLLANNSSSGNINFSGATSTINNSDELKVFSAGSITFNGASQTRGKFISAGNFTFNGNSTLYGEISAKGNIYFNGNATVVGVNSPPSDLSLNPTTSPENVANSTVIGTFTTTDANSSDTHTYTLVTGTGDSNNNAFNISGNQLRINNSPDFELLPSYTIRVRTTDQSNASIEKVFTVNITNINEAPTQLNLDTNSIVENSALGTTIGNFSTIDPDVGDPHTYSLIAGEGDTDNSAFAIVGNKLNLNSAVDFESQSNYSIRVRTTDVGGLNVEQVININISDLGEAPTEIGLNNLSINENVPNDSVVGIFNITDPDLNATHELSLVAGEGDVDNAAFTIVGNQLRIKETPNFESKTSYNIRVKAIDVDGLSKEQTFTINVNDLGEVPTDLSLSSNNFSENLPASSQIATISTIDPDAGDTHNLSLVAGSGDTDNNAFRINGDRLYFKNSADFETKANYNLRVRTTDSAGNSLEKILYLNVNNVNEAPTELSLSNLSINENAAIDSIIGTFSTIDPDAGDIHTVSLVAGSGDADNGVFSIVDNQLHLNVSSDFESQSSYSIRVKTTDADGLSAEQIFAISVTDISETPTDLTLSATSIVENSPINTVVATLNTVDSDLNSTHTYELITGEGDTDNSSFNLVGNELRLNNSADFESKSSYSLRIRTTDQDGLFSEKAIAISVLDLNEAPTEINLSSTSIDENSPVDKVIATLSSSDPDAEDTHTYSLVAGEGDTDNNSFNLVGNELRLNNSADFESLSNYSIRIRSTDAVGLFKDEIVTISVKDILEAEFSLNLNLAKDTGADNTDRITSDATIKGSIDNSQGDITLSASLNDAEAVELGDLVGADGSFTLGIEQLKLINNGDIVDGSYTLQLIATDSGTGKTTESELAFTLDTSAPTLNLITPLADGDHSSKARLTGTVAEDKLADVTYSLDGEEIGAVTVDNAGNFNSDISSSGLELGQHTVQAIATDIAGNQTSTEVSFQVGDSFLTPNGTKGWGAKNDSALILGEQDSYVVQTSVPVALGLATNEEGEQAGTRTISFDVDAVWDDLDAKAIEDQLLVYLVDPANPSQTLLDNGKEGTAVFSLAGEVSDFTPGLVSFDGKTVTIDASSLKDINQGLLVFQLLNQDDDTGSRVTVNNLTSTTDLEGFANPVFPDAPNPVAVGGALNFARLTKAGDVETIVSNVRFDAATGEYKALVSIKNNGETAISRNSAVVFNNLPDGVELASPSGTDSLGNPYVNLRSAIASGGLEPGKVSESVEVVLNNPNLIRFGLDTTVFVGSPNTAPVFEPIDNLTVVPGAKLELNLAATDPNGDPVTYRLQSDDTLPTGTLEGNGILKFNPKPNEIGSYEFTIIATDGVEEVSQTVTLDVVADPITTTRISGVIQNVEQQPLAGVEIELGELETVTAADGSFTIETDQPLTADTLKIRGAGVEGNKVYPFIAEKLPLLLEQEVYEGFNNVIDRPIYLPALDIASGQVINPNKDITVTSENIPEASVFVEAGSLITQSGADFTGTLSITEVPTEFTPAALPENLSPDLVVTIQPGEMVFTTPAPITFPNRGGYAPGTKMDLWSINPETGDFDVVGKMKVSEDGSIIETIEGGIRNSSWHFPAPPPPPVRPPENEPRNEDDKCSECKAGGGFSSEVEYHSGAVIETHDLTTYSSNGSERGITLTYDSLRADPRPIIHFGYNGVTQLNAQQKLIADLTIEGNGFEYQVPGFAGGQYGLNGGEHFWSIPNQSGNLSVGLQADMQDLPSGLYDYTVNSGLYRFNNQRFIGSSSDSSGDFVHVNSINSSFGSGWSIAGWQELVENSDGSILLIDGDGSELLFEAAKDGAGYVSPPGDFSTLEKLPDGTFKRTTTDQMVYEFNSANALESVTDRNGNQTSYEYNSQSQLTKIVDPVGLATVLSYNEAGLVSKITDPGVRVTQLEYDTAGNLTRITDPDGATRTWSYDANRLMVSEIDQRGNLEQATYDQYGRAESAQLKDGSTVQVDPLQTQGLYSPEATIKPLSAPNALIENTTATPTTAYADSNGNVTVTEVDKAGQAISAFDGGGQLPTTERNQQNLITSKTDARGFNTDYTYDKQGNVLTIEDSLTLTNNVGNKVLIVNGAAASSEPQLSLDTTNTIDLLLQNNGFQTTISDGLTSDISEYDQIWDLRFDNNSTISNAQTQQYLNFLKTGGNLFLFGENSIFKARNNSILNLIEEAGGGQLDYALTSPSQQVLSPFNSPKLISDKITFKAPGGVTTAGEGQLIATDENNRGVGVAFGRGSLSQAAAGELTAIFDLNFLQDAGSNVNLQKLLDNLAQLENKSASKTYSYDPVFNQVTSYTDELGRLTLNDLDPNNGNLLATTKVVGQIGGADDLTTSYSYTDAGLVDIMTDPMGRVTDYQYDLKGRLIKEIQAVGTADEATISYEYDAVGNQTAIIDENGNRTEFEYDQNNRVTKITEADPDGVGSLTSPVTSLTYDQSGNLVKTIDPLGNSTEQKYDELNRQISVTDSLGQKTNYEYDNAGNIIAMIDGLGRRSEYSYDGRNRLILSIDPEGNETKYKYDLNDNLTAIIDSLGNTTRNFYDTRNRLFRTIDAEGNITNYEYDGRDNLIATVDANGDRTEYEYDDLDRQIKQINPLGDIFTTEYDKVGNVIATTDEEGRNTELTYDSLDRLTSTTNAIGGVASLEYDAVGNVIATTDQEGRTTTFGYDAQNRQTSITDPLNNVTTSQYDANDNLIAVTDANDNTTSFEYDELNRQIGVTNPLGDTFSTDYDQVGNVTAITDELGRATEFGYDQRNLQTSVTNALGNTTTTEYDSLGNVESVTDARGNTTSYEYDKLSRLISEIDANGGKVSYQYDGVGNLTGVTDQLNRTTSFKYDELNRQIKSTNPLQHSTNWTYDSVGNLISTKDAAGHTTSYQYDELNRQTVTTNQYGDKVTTAYDQVGNLTSVTDELGRTTKFTYDERNLQTSITDPLNHTSTTEYDAVGNPVSLTDPLGNKTTYGYDELYRLTNQTDAENRTTAYYYDPLGNLISLIDPEQNTTTYTYDDLNRLITDTNQLGNTRTYEYDAVGNQIASVDRNGREINYQYDQLNRNTAEVWLDSAGNPVRTFNFQYDAASQLLNASDPDSAYSYTYDQDGRVISVNNAGTPGVPNVVFNYTYDPVDNLIKVTDNIEGVNKGVETFTFDELDRVTKITQSGNGVNSKRVDMSYDAADQMTQVSRYSDLAGTEEVAQSNYTFDEAGRLTNLVHDQDGTMLSAYEWVYDAADRITSATSPDGVSDYDYDKTDQLTEADHEGQADESYSYDDNGNRINDGYVTGENNQLQSDGKYNYEYDAEGNRTKRTEIATGEVTEYEWDYRNRLVDVVTKDSTGNVTADAEYTYDVFDNRIAKSVDADGDGAGEAEVEKFVYDGDHIALTFDGEGHQTERFLHGTQIDQVLAQENADGEVLWALTDNLGSVRVLMDNQGNVVNQITYDSFGNVTAQTNAGTSFRFSYTGREFDSETGLYYYRARYYDPGVGRFISEDPIGFNSGDSNTYRYVGNNPLFYVDPSGFCGATPFESDNDLDISLNEPVIDLNPDLDISLNEPVVDLNPDLDISLNEPVVDLNPDLDISLNEPVIDLIPDLNFDFPGDDTVEVAGEIPWPSFKDVVTGIGGAIVGVGKVISDQIQKIGNDDNNLTPDYFESQHGKQGDVGDSGIRREAQERIRNGDASDMNQALRDMMQEAKEANNGRGDKKLQQRIKREQKEQQLRRNRNSGNR
jgi:RHS repeat-associated protein